MFNLIVNDGYNYAKNMIKLSENISIDRKLYILYFQLKNNHVFKFN